MINQCGTFIPTYILSGAIGWIVSFGMVGTAVVPLLTGILADAKGVVSLQPLSVSTTTASLLGIDTYIPQAYCNDNGADGCLGHCELRSQEDHEQGRTDKYPLILEASDA